MGARDQLFLENHVAAALGEAVTVAERLGSLGEHDLAVRMNAANRAWMDEARSIRREFEARDQDRRSRQF